MNGLSCQSFTLQPFSPPGAPAVTLRGEIRRDRWLRVSFVLEGELARLDLPHAAQLPLRQDELWRRSCFEVFFGPRRRASYWEVNRSPAGHWNVYRFDGYRKGMREEPRVLGVACRKMEGSAGRYDLAVDLRALELEGTALAVGISAVLRAADTTLSHWALRHPAPRPDFHHRRGRCLLL
ncbi:MAG: DOMON-like domain-containing protein [Thermodesulfobacteriota bacterium]